MYQKGDHVLFIRAPKAVTRDFRQLANLYRTTSGEMLRVLVDQAKASITPTSNSNPPIIGATLGATNANRPTER